MKVSTEKLTLREFRMRLALAGILTIVELADHIACSRTAIYLALKNPRRYPRVFGKITDLITRHENPVAGKAS